jgi:capsular polysaccharide transport system permease protein
MSKPEGRAEFEGSIEPESTLNSERSSIARDRLNRRRRKRDEHNLLEALSDEARPEETAGLPNRSSASASDAAGALASPEMRVSGRRRQFARSPGTEADPDQAASVLLTLPPLPEQAKASWSTRISFLICVILPVMLAWVYYGYYASAQYVSEFRFVVTESDTAPVVSTSTAATSALAAAFGTPAMPGTTRNYMVPDYLVGMQGIRDVLAKLDVMAMYSRPDIDWWSRFDGTKPVERFEGYWRRQVTASYDQVTGLSICEVRAFSAEDAYRISSTLMELAERLINTIAKRVREEAIRNAEAEVTRAETRLKSIRAEMTTFRNKEGVIDPNTSVVTNNVTLAQTVRTLLTQQETELLALRKQKLSPNAPQIQAMQTKIQATKEQLATIEAEINTAKTGASSISEVVGKYEQLDLERQFAQNMVLSTMQSLEQVRASSLTQHIFVTPYVLPSTPTSATYPRRALSIATVGLAALFLWAIGLLVVRSIREHLA